MIMPKTAEERENFYTAFVACANLLLLTKSLLFNIKQRMASGRSLIDQLDNLFSSSNTVL